MIEPKFPFFGVFRQVLFRHMNVGAVNPALKVLPKVLHPVDMDIATAVFVPAVVNGLMVESLLAKIHIRAKLIRMNRRAFLDVFLNDWFKRFLFAVRDDLGHYFAAALHHTKHNRFVCRSATTNSGPVATNIIFIDFHIPGQKKFPINVGHVLADELRHAPRRLVSHAKLAFKFFGRDAMPGSGEKVNGIKPQLQRCAGILKRGSDCWVQMMAAPLARESAFRLKTIPVRLFGALRACVALAKTGIKKMLQANFVRGELFHELADRYAGPPFFTVFSLHA